MELLLYFVHNLTYTGLLNTAILKNMIFEILNYRLISRKMLFFCQIICICQIFVLILHAKLKERNRIMHDEDYLEVLESKDLLTLEEFKILGHTRLQKMVAEMVVC